MQTPYIAILSKSGKRSSRLYVYIAASTHVTCGRKTLQMYGFPIQTYGRHSMVHIHIIKGVNKKSIQIKLSFEPFCVPI